MSDVSYVVVGLAALIDCEGGMTVMVQNGGAVPSNAKPTAIEHLLSVNLIAEGQPEGGLAPSGHVAPNLPAAPAASGSDDSSLGAYPLAGSEADQDAWIANAKVGDVIGYVVEYPETGTSVLAAEQRKGEKARSSLIAELTKLTEGT